MFSNAPQPDLFPAIEEIFKKIISWFPLIPVIVKNTIGIIIGLSIPLSIFFFIVIIYCVEQLKRIREAEYEKYDAPVIPAYVPSEEKGDAVIANRWESIKKHMESENPNDWRQAILDCDIILDDLLNKMGYRGETVGEKLKRAEKGDFVTLDDAWQAHKVRNLIAHVGTDYKLNEHEARETFNRYKRVFEEFYYI